MTTKTSIDKSTLLPLEYCAPKRAAALLGCQVGDIYHWAACDEITLYFDANGYTNATKKHLLADIVSDFGMDLEHGASAHLFSDVMRPGLIPTSYDDQDSIFLDEPFALRGLWRIPCDLPRIWEHTEIVTLPEDEFLGVSIQMLYAYKTYDNGASDRILTGKIPIEVTDFERWIIILRPDLLLLEKHINSGNPFTPVPTPVQDAKAEMLSSRRSAAQKERHTKNRDCVYVAILRALALRKEECLKSAANWAKQVFDLEDTLFEDGACPLSQDTVTKMISTAMNKGQRHWE